MFNYLQLVARFVVINGFSIQLEKPLEKGCFKLRKGAMGGPEGLPLNLYVED
jgi:hypothetical protein